MNNRKNTKEERDVVKKYQVLTETSPDCIKLFDVDGKLLYINPSGLEEHNLNSLDDAIKSGWMIEDSVIEEDKPLVRKAIEEALRGVVSDIEIRHTEGTKRENCLETVAPVKDDSGKVVGIFGVSRDITKMKNTERELNEIKKSLEETVKKRTAELKIKVEELESVNSSLVGRELKMIELKEKITDLERQLGIEKPEKTKDIDDTLKI